MKKGYISKNRHGRWELNFIVSIEVDIDGSQHVVVETYNDYSTHAQAFAALVKVQKGFK